MKRPLLVALLAGIAAASTPLLAQEQGDAARTVDKAFGQSSLLAVVLEGLTALLSACLDAALPLTSLGLPQVLRRVPFFSPAVDLFDLSFLSLLLSLF